MDELNLASMLLSVPLVTAAVLGSVALGRLAAGVFFGAGLFL